MKLNRACTKTALLLALCAAGCKRSGRPTCYPVVSTSDVEVVHCADAPGDPQVLLRAAIEKHSGWTIQSTDWRWVENATGSVLVVYTGSWDEAVATIAAVHGELAEVLTEKMVFPAWVELVPVD